jgi:hypothetical protein
MEDLGYFSYFALRRAVRMFMHPESSANLWNGLLASGMNPLYQTPGVSPGRSQLSDYFDLIDLDTIHSVSSGPFSIECRRTIHSVPTHALRITVGGRVLGISADSAYDPALIDWLSSADLIIHEVTNLAESEVHTPYEKLATLPGSLRKRMRLIHYPDDFDLNASIIEPIREGRIYRV